MKKALFTLTSVLMFFMGSINAQSYYEVGLGTQTTNYFPTYFFYNHGCSQMIYNSTMLSSVGMGGDYIYGISFNYLEGIDSQRYIRVYMFNPNETSFSSNDQWWDDESEMLLVYSGEYKTTASAGWKTIWFEKPYYYTEGDNIGIAIYDNSGEWFSSRNVYGSDFSGGTLNVYSDNQDYYPDNIINYTGTIRNTLPNIRFHTSNSEYNPFASIPTYNAPWYEDFDETPRAIDSNWFTQNDYSFIWKFDNENTSNTNGISPNDGNGYAHIFAHNGYELEATLLSPIINMDGNIGILSFSYCNKAWSDDFDELTVLCINPDDESFTELATIDNSNDSWQEVSFQIPPSDNIMIGFKASNGYGYGIGIDDISVEAFRFAANLNGNRCGLVNEPLEFSCNSFTGADYEWQIEGTTYNTNNNTAEAQWSEPGTYRVIVSITWGSNETSDTLDVTIMNHQLTCFAFNSLDEFFDWTTVDNDGDGINWNWNEYEEMIFSESYSTGVALTPDNWIISPTIHIPNNTTALTWYDYAYEIEDFAEHYAILVSTSGTDMADFTDVIYETTIDKPMYWEQHIAQLNNYSNQDIHIAFRHYDCTDQFKLLIDDICIFANDTTTHVNAIDNSALTVQGSEISIYPNPASDRVKVSANQSIVNITLFAINGAMVASFNPMAKEYVIDTEAIPSGTYFMKITTDSGTANRRLVIR